MATIDKIRLNGTEYTIVDSSKATMEEVNAAITAATSALSESFDEVLGDYVTNDELTAYTYDKATIDSKVGDAFDSDSYYDKSEVDGKLAEKVDVTAFTEYKGEVAAELADKLESSDIANYFDGASYNDATKNIEFTHDGTVKATVSALPFIKDGMVDDVKVEDGKLVITFNTDAGHEDIELEITDIFNASNYYTKAEADGKFGTLAEQNSLRSDVEDIMGEVASLEADKADATAVTASIEAAKAELQGKIDAKADASALDNYQTVSAATLAHNALQKDIDDLGVSVQNKADKADVYTKEESDAKYAVKATVEGTTLILG